MSKLKGLSEMKITIMVNDTDISVPVLIAIILWILI